MCFLPSFSVSTLFPDLVVDGKVKTAQSCCQTQYFSFKLRQEVDECVWCFGLRPVSATQPLSPPGSELCPLILGAGVWGGGYLPSVSESMSVGEEGGHEELCF